MTPGTELGPYEILSQIGAGGMGEVYRARDSKLGRDVALKVLPEAFARDAERMARFQREAKSLASLNHSNIASIYGLEDSGATHALVMELVEGPTLADRIRSGPIPIEEALPIAKQIAEGLEYAHERGIVHRDLKPSNVKVTNDDAVKILDFGLAKTMVAEGAFGDATTSPTISQMATQSGMLLGTAAYMSPEQARGKLVDRRADIWAFGCVLYEMLTGKMVFGGGAITDTLAAVLKSEPDWSLLPAETPIRIRVLLQRCLQKDPKQRLQAIGDARISLEEVLSGAPDATLAGTPQAAAPLWRHALPWAVAALFVLTTALLAFIHFREKPTAPAELTRLEIPLPENTTAVFAGAFALSPDGRQLAFATSGADGVSRLWVRPLDSLEARPMPGGESSAGIPPFFWSPDSRFVAFDDGGKLEKIDISGGPPQTLCAISKRAVDGSWNSAGVIIFGMPPGPLMRVSADGGPASPLTTLDSSRGEISDSAPRFLPDGRHFLYERGSTMPEYTGTYIGSLDAKPGEQDWKRLLANAGGVAYAPSSDNPEVGHLLFIRDGALMAQPFDAGRLELTGEPVAMSERASVAGFSAGGTGVLVYETGVALNSAPTGLIQGQLTWFDREGKALGAVGDLGLYGSLALSPDGKRVAFERVDPQAQNRNIWLYDIARGVATRFTFDQFLDTDPVWSPDGSRVAFNAIRGAPLDLYVKASNLAGQDQLLLKSNDYKFPTSWSRDGRFLLYWSLGPPTRVWALPLDGGVADGQPIPVASSQFNETTGRFSPDGRWIAYQSDESGKSEIYVRPFDASSAAKSSSAAGAPVAGRWMVSNGGGASPLWRGDGKELFYLSSDGIATAVELNTTGTFQAGVPRPLFKVPVGLVNWDVTPDGKRFLLAAPSATGARPFFTVVLNWQAGLKK
jgi:eukaryotic-like serine/threonine-protein kinase